jgi:LuxR family maltose regulon positive regulatory protein
MRVRGQVTELRERELRFSQAEAAQFFQQTMQLCLTESSVVALERQTEGWVAELLHHTLVHMPKMEPAVLHRRASAWYEQQGFLLEAVGHAFKAQDWTFAAELLERHAMNLIGQSQVVLLHEWIEGIPAAVTQTRPGLSIFHAWVLMLTYRTDYRPLACEKLAQAERALQNQAHPPVAPVGQGGACVPLREWVLGHASALRSQLQLAAFNEPLDPYELISLGQQGLALLPDVERTIRSTCAGTVALAYLMLGEVAQARQGLIETMQLAEEAGNQFGVANMHFYLARVAYLTGDHDRAVALCEEGLARLRPRFANPEQEFPAIRSLYVMQGVILLERDQLAEAQQLLELATNRVGYAPWVELIAYAALVRLWEQRDEPANVSAVLSRMAALGPQIAACGEALRFQHLSRQIPLEGPVRDAATQWAATYVPDLTTSLVVNGIGPYQVDAEYIVLTAWLTVQLALGNPQAALEAVTPILTVAEAKGFVQRVRELAPIRAAALQACAGAAPAPPAPAATDHHRSVGAPAPPGARQPDAPAVLPPAVPPAPLDALSERELEVLRLLAQGLTLAEVAERLVLSPYTVKAHTQNIYAKLDAHSRVEAINQARVRGLIT